MDPTKLPANCRSKESALYAAVVADLGLPSISPR
jgi:hypothetical protein